MRRAQIDKNSQLVRNLAGNPLFQSTSGTQVIRANLATHPNFELGGSNITVRTNINTDPAVTSTSTWTAGGLGTGTHANQINSRETGRWSRSGYTYRVTATSTSTFNQCQFTVAPDTMWAVTPGVTISSSVKVMSSVERNLRIRFRYNGGFGDFFSSNVLVPANTVTTLTHSHTPPAGATTVAVTVIYGTDQAAFTTGQWIEGSESLMEVASTPGPYFDGATAAAGDFTYAWSGTANSSTSLQRAPSVAPWLQSGSSVLYQSVTSPYLGTKCAAVATKGANGDGLYHADITITAGTTYTFSSWIKLTSSVPTMSGVLRWKDTPGNIVSDGGGTVHTSLVVGSWVRVSVTGVAPTGATKLQAMWRIYATHTSTTFYVDACMVEASTVATPYFDGSFVAAGDFTHNWTGTVNASGSEQRALMIPSLGSSRSASLPDGKFFVFQSTSEDGAKMAKWLSPAGTTTTSWRVASINGSSSQGWTVGPVKTNGVYTLWFRYRSSGWGSGQTFQTQIADGTSLNAVVAYDASVPLNATGWQEYRRTFTAIRDATVASQIYISLPTVPQAATDGIFEIKEWMLVPGTYTGDFINPIQNSLSKWEGTAHASTSIGYPPRLYDIAGKPDVDKTTTGLLTLPGGIDPLSPRTIYTVVQLLQDIPTAAIETIAIYGDTALNDTVPNTYAILRYHSETGAKSSAMARRTGGGGPIVPGVPTGVNVFCWGVRGQNLFCSEGGRAEVLDTGNLMVMDHEALNIPAANTYQSHVRTLIYLADHDAATRAAITRYLGNKYGENVV